MGRSTMRKPGTGMELSLKVTQGCYSYLPDLERPAIQQQLGFYLSRGLAIDVEYTREPHPRHLYWDMWGNPMFGLGGGEQAVDFVWQEIEKACIANPNAYVKVVVFDNRRGVESCVASFIVKRPSK